MIKKYFTDGLIGLAILLSLFQTDLIDLNINNLINYPEVQDIIQGQTALHVPANFHLNGIHDFGHPKLRDREAINELYRNLINLPHFHQNSHNEIEAFLVSGSEQSSVDPSFVNNNSTSIHVTEINSDSNNSIPIPENAFQALPQENAISFIESEAQQTVGTSANTATSSSLEQPLTVDVTFLFNNSPFPGCNLTTEDLSLIELLWKQDVDLGVGKEVYDQSLREELERQRDLEYFRQQDKLKEQIAAREKEEKSKQEEASRWLRQNFMRDGETGEWVKRQNKTTNTNNGTTSFVTAKEDNNDDNLTLEAALDYITSSVDPNDFVSDPEEIPVANPFIGNFPPVGETGVPPLTHLPQTEDIQQLAVGSLLSQESLENEWTQVEEYLNISLRTPPSVSSSTSATSPDFGINSLDSKHATDLTASLDTELPKIMESNMMFTSADLPLLQDANLASSDLEPVPELGAVSMTNSSMPPQPCTMNTSLDWELGNLTFFENLTALPEGNVDDIDLQSMESLFNTVNEASDLPSVNASDINQMMTENLSDTSVPMNSTSFTEELSDAFDGLEGATGGADFSAGDDLEAPYKKISRLSESSSDSGFAGKGGFSSSSSSSSSSYAGSPADSRMANNTSSNDTDHDPHGTRTLAHQVAHNHTYNTLPGHIPREVKKYAPKENTKKGPQCRDEKKAKELKIPFTVDQIVESPVETFNDILTKYSLNEDQLTLIRDIRRRGKNKLAAQNCRKRKVGVIVTLSDEMTDLQKARDRLRAERTEMEKETRKMKEKFGHLYAHIFQSLRDEHGQPYDPNLYSLQQSSDGNVFLVPRNVSINGMSGNNGTSSGRSRQNDNRIKKRKSDD